MLFAIRAGAAIVVILWALAFATGVSPRSAPSYRGSRFGELLAPSDLARAGLVAFDADRSAQIRGAFNESFCSECHLLPTAGGSQRLPNDFVVKEEDGHGRAVTFQRYVLVHGAVAFRRLPARRSLRIPPPLYGAGLLEAVPDDELRAVAASEARESPLRAGRLAALGGGAIGRFGWKATSATLHAFVRDAFRSELGIPGEERARDVAAITAFLQRLAAPPAARPVSIAGGAVFARLGCADCHRATLRLGAFPAQPGLAGTAIAPYSDLLLHDMGRRRAEYADGAASAREFRTAPLWGVASTGPPYLHDGAARSLSEAIVLHGGQAAGSAAAFEQLSANEREALLEYLRSL